MKTIKQSYFDAASQRFKSRSKLLAMLYAARCWALGHDEVDESKPAAPFNYQTTNMDDGTVTPHIGATQQVKWVYCGRCGKVLKNGLYFEGFVIPGRSSSP